MCSNCADVAETGILREDDFYRVRRRLADGVSNHLFIMTGGQELWPVLLGEVRKPVPDDAEFDFECSYCSSAFRLGVNFYRFAADWTILNDRMERKLPLV